MDSSRPFPLNRLLVPAVVILAVLALIPLYRGAVAVAFPFQLDREEGFLLNQAMELARGRTIYPPLDDYPYVVGNYPPLYPLLYALLVKTLSASLAWGRLLNLLFALGAAIALGGFLYRRTRCWTAALLAPALWIATYDFHEWVAYARVDLVALALCCWGVLRFLSAPERGGARGAALLFALALLTRQTLLAAPLACMIHLALDRNWIALRRFALRVLLYAGGTYGLLFLITGGLAWHHLVTYNVNPFHWNQVAVWAGHLWRFQKFAIVLTVLLPALWLFITQAERWRRESGEAPEHPPDGKAREIPGGVFPFLRFTSAYVFLAFCSFFMVGKEGAAANYLLEFHLAVGLFLGVQLGHADDARLTAMRQPGMGLLRVLLFLGISFHAVYLTSQSGLLFSRRIPGQAERLAGIEVLEVLERIPGEVITDEPVYAIAAGRPVLFQPFILSQLARQKMWDESRFVEDLRSGRFPAIVTTQHLFVEEQYFWAWTPAMRQAVREAYELHTRIGTTKNWQYWVYTPKRQLGSGMGE